MKRKISYKVGTKTVSKEYSYIPVRYIVAMLLSIAIILCIIGGVVALCYFYPKILALAYVAQTFCVLKIVASDDNPDYKVPWLLVVLVLPVVGFMLYVMFYSRKLKRKYAKKLKALYAETYDKSDNELLLQLKQEDLSAHNQASMLCRISGAHLFKDCSQRYFSSGEDYMASLLEDLRRAEKFIYMEYFIIEEGKFWTAILSVLKEKVLSGVDVKVVYDDIGCMTKLPGNYYKTLKRYGILATPFSKIRGSADSEFNNRSHRKITVIDGKVGYTGGVNIADEYINEKDVYGHFKDGGVRIEGESVWELTKLFLIDYGMNAKTPPFISNENFPQNKVDGSGFTIPFGDGPMPLYTHRVSKSAIQNMVNSANEYAYITTPYLIIDNALCQDLENCALRGVDVKIIIPGVPDKKIVYEITKSYCERLVRSGVKIYVYKKGFIHAKNYLVDDKFAIVGTSNLDYRSLVHHLENGVWMYKCDCIKDIKSDFVSTLNECELFKPRKRNNFVVRFLRSVVRIFAPLL